MASVLCKTEGIVLRKSLYSETSCVVHWLTPDHGRIATLIKGSFRPRSGFQGQFDSFGTSEVLFYHRAHGDVHVVREVSSLRPRDAFRTNWRATACASYLTDLVARASPPEAPHPEAYRLLDEVLDNLAEQGASHALIFWAELRLLHALGLAPRLTRCVGCRRELTPQDRGIRFPSARGGLLCGTCAEIGARNDVPIAPDVMAALSSWQRTGSPGTARKTRCTLRQRDHLESILGAFLTYHLDLPLPSRRICFDLIARQPGGTAEPVERSEPSPVKSAQIATEEISS